MAKKVCSTPSGFTLAELLIALVILGVIATFTIPKILSSQQDSRKKAVFRETIAAVQEAGQGLVYAGAIQTRSHTCNSVSPIDPDVFATRLNFTKRTDFAPDLTLYEMHNGSRVVVYTGEILQIDVDYNGTGAGTNTFGDDTVEFFFNDCNGDYGVAGPHELLKPGRFGIMNHLPAGKVTENRTLWEDIFKN